MTIARQKSQWDHTAALLATITNMMAEKPQGVEVFHPFLSKQEKQSRQTKAPRVSSLRGLV